MRYWILICCGLLAPTLVSAQSFRGPCKTEVLCKGVEPGGGRLIDCLRKHKRDLSVECRLSIADFFLNRPRQSRGEAGAGGSGGSGPRGAGRDGPGADYGGGPDDRGGPGPRSRGGGPDERAGPDGSGPDGPPPYDRGPEGPDGDGPSGR